jgi:single-stranded-DNA-specific exonuclease
VGNNHLKLTITQEGRQSFVDGIAFQLGHHHPMIESEPFDIVYHIEENSFNGRTSLQLNIKDLRLAKDRQPQSV